MALIKNIKDKIESKEEAAKVENIIKEAAKEISKERPAEQERAIGAKEKWPEKALSFDGETAGEEQAALSLTSFVQQARKEREKR